MITYPHLEQGSDAWHKLRLGIPTTSMFSSIITPGGKKSGSFDGYCNKLLAELITGEAEEFFKSGAMARGNMLEPEAVAYYEYFEGRKTREVGFITSDDARIGCSPDRLVGRDGLVEIKCPLQTQHFKNLVSEEIDPKYKPQVQGQMLLAEREWCDWVSYYPGQPGSVVRVERDEEYIAILEDLLGQFVESQDKKIRILKGKGVEFKANFGEE